MSGATRQVLIGVIALVSGWMGWHRFLIYEEAAHETECKANLLRIWSAVSDYRVRNGAWPPTLSATPIRGRNARLVCPSSPQQDLAQSYVYTHGNRPVDPSLLSNVPVQLRKLRIALFCLQHNANPYSRTNPVLAVTDTGELLTVESNHGG